MNKRIKAKKAKQQKMALQKRIKAYLLKNNLNKLVK